MHITNKQNLPQPIVDAIKNDDYSRGECDFSITQLIDSPRKVTLSKEFESEIEEDAADLIYALMGKAIHMILEKADTLAMTEQRLFTTIDSIRISGSFDRLVLIPDNNGIKGLLQDYKIVSVWEFIHGVKKERIEQLNCYAELVRRNGGYNISKLEIVFIFRDWQRSKAKYNKDYPQKQIAIIEVDLWSSDKVNQFLRDRIKMHVEALEILPLCTPHERWQTKTTYAVKKEGRKTALRVLDSGEEAQNYIDAIEKPGKYSIEERPGYARRCLDYCSVSEFCEQYQKEVKN